MNLKVLAVSTNTNSFGYYEVQLIDNDGTGWRALCPDLHKPQIGHSYNVNDAMTVADALLPRGFASVEQVARVVPAAILQHAWPDPTTRLNPLRVHVKSNTTESASLHDVYVTRGECSRRCYTATDDWDTTVGKAVEAAGWYQTEIDRVENLGEDSFTCHSVLMFTDGTCVIARTVTK